MSVRRAAAVGGYVLAALAVLALIGVSVLWYVQRDRTLPNTSIVGIDVSGQTRIDVSGQTRDEVMASIADLVAQREATSVSFTFEDETYTVDAADVGYDVDEDAMIDAAVGRGRSGALFADVVERIRSLRGEAVDLPIVEHLDEAAAAAWVADVAAGIDREDFPGAISIDDDLAVAVEPPIGSAEVQQDETLDLLRSALLHETVGEFELPVVTTTAPVSDADISAVAAQVERAIAAPLSLVRGDTSLVLEPEDLAQLLEIDVTGDPEVGDLTHELSVPPAVVETELGELGSDRFDRSPVDARFMTRRTPPADLDALGSVSFTPVPANVAVEPGRDGVRFDPELTAAQLTEMLRAGEREADIELEVVEPDLPTQEAERLRPTHLVGTFTSYYPEGEPRALNVQRLADAVNDAMMLPGEQFSIQELSGPRSCNQGYLPAGTIVNGELVDTCGGGVSQFGTTTFNAVFFSGFPLDQWRAHSWYLSRYPMGREATLYYPYLDVKFTNTSDGAVLVKTDHTEDSVTVSIYAQPIATRVSAEHGRPTEVRGFPTEVRTASDLGPGQERVLQPGIEGFRVEVVRVIERTNGETTRQSLSTLYEPQTRIVEVGA
jgi:vancomycin resistance protein YoaR